jgi:hypothetical protein
LLSSHPNFSLSLSLFFSFSFFSGRRTLSSSSSSSFFFGVPCFLGASTTKAPCELVVVVREVGVVFSGGEDREHLGHVPICWLSTSQALKLRNSQAEGEGRWWFASVVGIWLKSWEFFLGGVDWVEEMEESIREQDRESIRAACAQVPLIDAHAHNVVTLDSNLPFLHCFSEARGHEALSFVPHSLSFQRSVQDLAGLYGCEPTLAAIEQYRQSAGLATISEKCFDAANIEFVLLDDGLTMDKMVSMGWHRKYIPGVHRVLRIETVAEAILNQVQGWLGIASESPC